MTEVTLESKELKKFSEIDATISEMELSVGMLKITDLESKEQFDKVHDTRMVLVKMRTQGIDKIATEIMAPHKDFIGVVTMEQKKRIEQIKNMEAKLQVEEDKVLAEKERIRIEKARKAQEKVQARIDKMRAVGGCVEIAVLSLLSDEEFETEFKKSYDLHAEKTALADAERIQKDKDAQKLKEDTEKLAEDARKLQKEQDDFRIEKEKLALKQKEVEDAQKAIDDRQNAIEDAKKVETAPPTENKVEPLTESISELQKIKNYVEALNKVEPPVVIGDHKIYLVQIQGSLKQMTELVHKL